VGEVYGYLSSVSADTEAADPADADDHLGTVAGHGIGERDDNLMIAGASAGATFNAGIAGKRQINIECAGCAMCLSRDNAGWYWRWRARRVPLDERLIGTTGGVLAD